jgi:hypothetical protein
MVKKKGPKMSPFFHIGVRFDQTASIRSSPLQGRDSQQPQHDG